MIWHMGGYYAFASGPVVCLALRPLTPVLHDTDLCA